VPFLSKRQHKTALTEIRASAIANQTTRIFFKSATILTPVTSEQTSN